MGSIYVFCDRGGRVGTRPLGGGGRSVYLQGGGQWDVVAVRCKTGASEEVLIFRVSLISTMEPFAHFFVRHDQARSWRV